MSTISTRRLTLRAATLEIARADARDDRAALAALLDVKPPEDWPPPLFGEDRLVYHKGLEAHPDRVGWLGWYWILTSERVLVGCGGVSWPGPHGDVEVGYSVVASHRGQGYAPEALEAMMQWAFNNPAARRIVAHTFPHLAPSIRVLEKSGFKETGLSADGVLMYERGK